MNVIEEMIDGNADANASYTNADVTYLKKNIMLGLMLIFAAELCPCALTIPIANQSTESTESRALVGCF